MHTGGPCDTLQTGSGKARQRPEETRKTCPVKVIQTTRRARLSLRAHPCVYPHVSLFPPNKHFTCFTTFCLCVKIHFCTADGPGAYHQPLVPGGLVARIQCSHCCSQTSFSSWELKSCFKLLQAEVTREKVQFWKVAGREGGWENREQRTAGRGNQTHKTAGSLNT